MAACVGLFSACTNDVITDELIGNGSSSEKNAYASFSFVMPGSGAGTRATGGPAGDGSEVGSKVENDFTEAYILLFTGDVLEQTVLLGRNDFTPKEEGNNTTYTTKADIAVSAATYNVYVVLNPTTDLKTTIAAKTKLTYTQFLASFEAVAATTGEYCTDGRFMMTNADEIVSTVVTDENTQGKAKQVSINVERLAAKITFVPKDGTNNVYNVHDVNDIETVIGTVAFDAYKVINTRNSAFNLRRVSALTDIESLTIGGKETAAAGIATNYVVENEWTMKAKWDADKFKANYSRKHTDYVAFRKLTTSGQTLAYCLENTMPADKQIEGYSTTVILRAKTSLKKKYVVGLAGDYGEDTYSGNLYKYAGKFFASRQAIVKSENPNWDNDTKKGLTNNTLGILTYIEKVEAENKDKQETEKVVINQELILAYLNGIESKSLYDDYGVEFYANGNCYYKVILRHSDNSDSKVMGIMEFAIVRNNVYKLSIEGVNFLGSCSSGTPGPTDPENPGTGEPDVDPNNPNPEIPGEVVTPDPENPEPVGPIIPIDPTDPDEKNDTYLNVTIKVLDWTVRKNGVIL